MDHTFILAVAGVLLSALAGLAVTVIAALAKSTYNALDRRINELGARSNHHDNALVRHASEIATLFERERSASATMSEVRERQDETLEKVNQLITTVAELAISIRPKARARGVSK